MSNHHTVKSRKIGQVRIYMTPGERRAKPGKSLKSMFSGSTPLYVEIIKSAKQDGLLTATAHPTHCGFSGSNTIQADGAEIPNARLTLCVELIGPREQLELFCRKHGDLLHDKQVLPE